MHGIDYDQEGSEKKTKKEREKAVKRYERESVCEKQEREKLEWREREWGRELERD